MALQREEQKLITDIKKAAKQNNTQAMKVLAKSLVRLRGQMNQLRASEAQLRGVKTSITVSPCFFTIFQMYIQHSNESPRIKHAEPIWQLQDLVLLNPV